jgi:hypothetical protein
VQVDAAALELELVDLALAVVFAAGLEGEDLQVAREVLELGQQLSYGHLTQCSVLSAVCGVELGGNCSISSDRTRRDDRTRWLLDQAAAEAGTTSSLDGADRDPSRPPDSGRSPWREGTAFRACCFAGKLRSPAGSDPLSPWPRTLR